MFDKVNENILINPYGIKVNYEWKESVIDVEFLREIYGEYKDYEDLIENTKSEGLKLFFRDLNEQGILN